MTDTRDRIAQALEARFGTQLPLPADTTGLDSLRFYIQKKYYVKFTEYVLEILKQKWKCLSINSLKYTF